MNKIIYLLIFTSVNLFAQSSSNLEFDELKLKIEEKKINFENLGTKSKELNNTEIEVLELLNNNPNSLEGKKIAFVTGPSGTTISNKITFFDSFKTYYSTNNSTISFSIIELKENQKKLSGVDVIIFFWTKINNYQSKKLLKKIQQNNIKNINTK